MNKNKKEKMKLVAESLNEINNFQRGQVSKDAMRIDLSNEEVQKNIIRQAFSGCDISFRNDYGRLIVTVYPDERYPGESEEEPIGANYYWDEDENEWVPDV